MHILLADDHRLFRDGIKFFLEKMNDTVDVVEADTLDEALAHEEDAEPPDLILLDLVMPGMHGLAGLDAVRARYPGVPVVIVTGFYRREDVFKALDRGAQGFIPKTLSGQAMLNALQLVTAGERYVPSAILSEVPMPGFAETRPSFVLEAPFDRLTRRERDVLAHLTHGATNREIADQLGLKEVTVKVHLKGVFRKLGVTNRTQAVRLALDSGWRH